ncbi:MAG: histidinol-phosphatase [Thermocrispum sp.]
MTRPYADDIRLAARLADTADAMTVPRFTARDLVVRTKPDRSPVTDADVAVEQAIRAVLATERPDDDIAGEEGGGEIGAGRTWVLDPIDGTKNFLRGVPVWATLIALVVDGVPVAGMISAPLLARRWWADTGGGAWVADPAGERRIAVSQVSGLHDAYLSTTNLSTWGEYHSQQAYLRLVADCWENRAVGDFWSHCLVAEGAIDVAAEPIVNPWDVAVAQILVSQAGGRFTDLTGSERFDRGSALSTNGVLHEAVLDVLNG